MTELILPLQLQKSIDDCSVIDISAQWQILGPFQIGTREATWGADPLELLGGFRTIEYNKDVSYHSSLGLNGSVSWSDLKAHGKMGSKESIEVALKVGFPDIDWTFLQSVYGWASLQYQAWARGWVEVKAGEARTIVLFTDNILEFWVDDTPFFGGDVYAYRRAPVVIKLEPGKHRFDIRLVRDVRAMGGVGEPRIDVRLRIELSNGGLVIGKEKLLLPELVNERLASSFASLPIRNEENRWIQIRNIESTDDSFNIDILKPSMSLAPGQSRPLTFCLTLRKPEVASISFVITYVVEGDSRILCSTTISSAITSRNISEPHRITFLHPGGIVSYAVLRAPQIGSIKTSPVVEKLPILLNLHGAGLEADSYQVRHMLDSVPHLAAWVLFPAGVTPWSGDDWHAWGSADIQAAILAVQQWINSMRWEGPGLEMSKLLISGHSNGGQGTWFMSTHNPDAVLGAAPVSGYSSIQSYVPYQFWQEMDPMVASVLQSSMMNYRHELLTDNLVGIPIFQQHGGSDENVPVYHSRRMSQLISYSGGSSNYVELPGRGHWFDGVMATDPLKTFYASLLKTNPHEPRLPKSFTYIVSSSGDFGSRGGIIVDQLKSPEQLGRIEVTRDEVESTWYIKTSNIHRFHISSYQWKLAMPMDVMIDASESLSVEKNWFVNLENGSWAASTDPEWRISQRFGPQLGALDSILRSQGSYVIRSRCASMFGIASQVARNLFQYFAADSRIVEDGETGDGNIITILEGPQDDAFHSESHPIDIGADVLSIRDTAGRMRSYPFEKGMGTIFLRTIPHGRLELVIWGFDKAGLRNAARLVPMLTGVGQPDFVVVSKSCTWKGAGGVLAMGFLDYQWNVSQASFLS